MTVSPASGLQSPTNDSTIDFTATFAEAVNTNTSFTSGDVIVTGTAFGTAVPSVTVTASDSTNENYTIAVSGITGPGSMIVAVPPERSKTPPATTTWPRTTARSRTVR